jgi:acetolactate synthase-1/2/3 large subunit
VSETVSSVLLKIMKKHGVRHVFGLPAAQLGLVMDGVSRDPFFRYVTTRHEEACGHMAHAAAKVTGEIAACFATVGPGGTNMVPGVACAWADNVPILVLTPNNQSTAIDPGRDLLQNSPQIDLYRPITKWNAQIRYPERAGELIERALYLARSGRPGPVHLDIPCDVGTLPCDYDPAAVPAFAVPRPAPAPAELEAVLAALAAARRPLLLAGGGVVRSGATAAFRALLQKTGFPATTTMNGRGVIPQDAETHLGSGGVMAGRGAMRAYAEADLILAIGCKFSSWIPVNKPPAYPVPAGQRIIQVDSDPDTLGKTAPISRGIVADARTFLELLVAEIDTSRSKLDPAWVRALVDETRRYRAEVDAIADRICTEGTKALNEAAAARALSRLLPEDAIIVVDGGQVMEWGHTFLHPRDPQSFLFGPGMGHLGMGLPFANAAAVAAPGRPVVLITGDGAMGCTVQELETAARYGLKVVTLVCNDAYWGMYRPFGEQIFDNQDFGVRLRDVDFATVAKGFGCHGERVADLDALPGAFRRALDAPGPAVLDLPVDFTPHPLDMFWLDVVLKGMRFN